MSEEISSTVKMLCERMQTNPEDFIQTGDKPPRFYILNKYLANVIYKRHDAFTQLLWFLTDAERDALNEAYKKMMRENWEQSILNGLMYEPHIPTELESNNPYLVHNYNPAQQNPALISSQINSLWDSIQQDRKQNPTFWESVAKQFGIKEKK